jgi:hypothetical protein
MKVIIIIIIIIIYVQILVHWLIIVLPDIPS